MKVLPLGEVCTLEYGKPLDKEFRKPDGAFQAYGANGPISSASKYLIEGPCVIVGRKGSAGEITYVKENVWPLDVTYYVKHDPKESDLRYLFYTLQNLDIKQFVRGVKPGLNRNDVYNLPIPLPSLEKQREIVEKLEGAFAEIDLLERNLGSGASKANQLWQSLLSSALSSTKGQNNFTKFFTVIPDSKSKIKSSSYLESGKYAVVDQGKELVAGYTDTSLTVDEKSLPVVVFGDHTRAVKYVDFPFTAGADGTQILKPSALTNPKYGFYLVLHAVGQIPSKGYARHFGELKKMQFQLPSLGEQRKVVEKLDSAFAEIEILKAQVNVKKDYATALRQSLLSSAFTQEEAFA